MLFTLQPHPATPTEAVTAIAVGMIRERTDRLILDYRVTADLRRLSLQPFEQAERAHELWRSTCLEAFIAAGDTGAYYELNFAPSHKWAAYRFDAYRTGMAEAEEPAPTRIRVERHGGGVRWFRRSKPQGRFTLQVALHLPADVTGPVALSAVIEEVDGTKSYWALHHRPGAPDFHHPDCFTAELPQPIGLGAPPANRSG